MNDDVIKIFEDFINLVEINAKKIDQELQKAILDIYKRIKNLLHINYGKLSQQFEEFEKTSQIQKIKELIAKQENFLNNG